ncbi:MAG: spondin domain-containing protein, partial [Hyphomicrobiaceae bacterium]|nr:spondin domain-containing protein [Hyphomicrobiaceae bacterium]
MRASVRLFTLLVLILVFALPLGHPVRAGDDTAKFELIIDITWSAQTAPHEYPEAGGHLSRLIGATHRVRYSMFRDGHTASSGLEALAEVGRPDILKAELADAQRRSRVGTIFELPRLDKVPGSMKAIVEASKEFPLLSFVTMLAPSPDWFTGLSAVALLVDGQWLETGDYHLVAWDAGSDSGNTYVAPNADTQPRESVRLVATRHFLGRRGLVPVGSVKIKRMH